MPLRPHETSVAQQAAPSFVIVVACASPVNNEVALGGEIFISDAVQ
jgi:hypothetical protein